MMMSNPRVFLSLQRDLATRGYEVWQDVNRLKAGRPWDEGVSEGLRNAQVLLVLLSPESVCTEPGC
jgi:hypothetical protein